MSGGNKCNAITSLIRESSAVYKSVLGTCLVHNDIALLEDYNILLRKDHHKMIGKVKILAGGGSGLEPAETGFVGQGVLTAAVFGEMFVAPQANSIMVAIRELSHELDDGILLLVKNYLGDNLNFNLAYEQALKENFSIQMLVVSDDCTYSNPGKYGRRGSAGIVLVYKIAGAMAEAGKSLDDIVSFCKQHVLDNLSTASVCLSVSKEIKWIPCHKQNEVIYGIGVYGQNGIKKNFSSIQDTIIYMLDCIFKKPEGAEGDDKNSKDKTVVVLVNNLGGTSKFDEGVICTEIMTQLGLRDIALVRLYAGTFMSLLDSKGFSISVLEVTDPDVLNYLEAPTQVFSWSKVYSSQEPIRDTSVFIKPVLNHNKFYIEENKSLVSLLSEDDKSMMEQIISFACNAILSCEKQINIIDAEVGDGDTGTMLKILSNSILEAQNRCEINLNHPYNTLRDLARVMNSSCGGITGAIYTIMFSAAAEAFLREETLNRNAWCRALKMAMRAVKCICKTDPRDRTLYDALYPAIAAFETCIEKNDTTNRTACNIAVTVEYHAEETKKYKPLNAKGYLPTLLLYPDAGAHAAAVWIRAVCEGVKLKYPE